MSSLHYEGKRRKISAAEPSGVVDLPSPGNNATTSNNDESRRNRKRGRVNWGGEDEMRRARFSANEATTSGASAASSPPVTGNKRRRVGPSQHSAYGSEPSFSGGQKSTGEVDAVVCLLGDSSEDEANDLIGKVTPRKGHEKSAAEHVSATVDLLSPPSRSAPSSFAASANDSTNDEADDIRRALAASAAEYEQSYLGSAQQEGGRNIDHEKKREHFEDARRPEKLLQEEILHLRGQLCRIPSGHGEEWTVCQQQLQELQSQLDTTRKNAAEDIFNRNNSAGGMGRVDADGRVCIDFHGLYVKDAVKKYEEMVLPILPVQMECAIVTGQGKHSGNGKSALRDGLMQYIHRSDQVRQGQIQCRVDTTNQGRLLVRWVTKGSRHG